jgi:hypothetical protein
MTARELFAATLLVGLTAFTQAVRADETPRIFHVGIVAGTPRSSPERELFSIARQHRFGIFAAWIGRRDGVED